MQIGTYTTQGPVLADTNATANSFPLRDAAGGITHALITCTQLILNGSIQRKWSVKTGTYAIQVGLGGDYIIYADSSTGNVTLTLPSPSLIGAGGVIRVIKKASANSVIINPNVSETINGASSKTITTQYLVCEFESDGTNWIASSRTVL